MIYYLPRMKKERSHNFIWTLLIMLLLSSCQDIARIKFQLKVAGQHNDPNWVQGSNIGTVAIKAVAPSLNQPLVFFMIYNWTEQHYPTCPVAHMAPDSLPTIPNNGPATLFSYIINEFITTDGSVLAFTFGFQAIVEAGGFKSYTGCYFTTLRQEIMASILSKPIN